MSRIIEAYHKNKTTKKTNLIQKHLNIKNNTKWNNKKSNTNNNSQNNLQNNIKEHININVNKNKYEDEFNPLGKMIKKEIINNKMVEFYKITL